MPHSKLFKSIRVQGAVLNRYGCVLIGANQVEPEVRDEVQREAKSFGWRLVPSRNRDEGMVWESP